MKIAMNLKAKALLATAVVSIGLFVNASPIWAEPQPLTIPSDGIVLQGKAKEKYAADYMKTYFQNIRTMKAPAPFEAPAGWKMETVTVNGITLERMTADQKKSDRVLLQMHGGGYVGGMSNNHRILGLRQATLADAGEVYFVNYRASGNSGRRGGSVFCQLPSGSRPCVSCGTGRRGGCLQRAAEPWH